MNSRRRKPKNELSAWIVAGREAQGWTSDELAHRLEIASSPSGARGVDRVGEVAHPRLTAVLTRLDSWGRFICIAIGLVLGLGYAVTGVPPPTVFLPPT